MKTQKHRTRWIPGLVAVLLMATLFALPAQADESQARRAYDQAQQMLGREDYRAAAREFAEFREEYSDSSLAASAAYWEAFALYRIGETGRLEEARDLLLDAEEFYGEDGSTDREELLARIEGSLARRGDAGAAEEIQRRSEDGEDEAVRIAALNALMNMDSSRALPILARLVSDHESSPELREQAVFLISQQEGPEVTEILLSVVRTDPSREVRGQAVFWLGQHGGEAATDALEEVLLNESDPEMMEKAMFALSQQDSPRARELLLGVAANKALDDETRGQAIFWVGQQGGSANVAFLKELYADLEDPDVKEKVLFSVSQSDGRAASDWLLQIASDPAEGIDMRAKALFWAGQTGSLSVAQLMEIYQSSDDYEMKEQVIFVLSQDDSGDSVDALLELAKTETDLDLRTKAIFWLGQSDDPRVVDYLGELIER